MRDDRYAALKGALSHLDTALRRQVMTIEMCRDVAQAGKVVYATTQSYHSEFGRPEGIPVFMDNEIAEKWLEHAAAVVHAAENTVKELSHAT